MSARRILAAGLSFLFLVAVCCGAMAYANTLNNGPLGVFVYCVASLVALVILALAWRKHL